MATEVFNVLYLIIVGIEAIVVTVTLILGFVTYFKNKCSERQDNVTKLCNEFITNNDLHDAVHIVEFESNWFGKDFYNGGKDSTEKKIDKLFMFLNHIIYLKNNKRISDEDFKLFEYKIKAVFQNPDTIEYLSFIESFSKIGRRAPSSFQQLIEYGRKNNYLE